jgi:hypothetical protein
MSKISINCNNDNELKDETVCFNETRSNSIKSYIVVVDPHGSYAISFGQKNIFFYDSLSLKHSIINITWSNCTTDFIPHAADVSIQFVYIIGYCIESRDVNQSYSKRYFKTVVYLLSIAFDNNKYEVKFHDLSLHETLDTYSQLKYLSISVNNNVQEKILVGIPGSNTVHLLSVDKSMKQYRLRHISSKQVKNGSEFVYGTNVAWLNQGQKAGVSYDDVCEQLKYSGLFLYDMTNNSQFTDKMVASSIFPNEN